MKTKNSSSRPEDWTPGVIRYCNYYLEFPDGDVWSDFTHVAGGFVSWIERTALWKKDPELARMLATKGEAHWKDHNGVEHRMIISETPCNRKWGKPDRIKRQAFKQNLKSVK